MVVFSMLFSENLIYISEDYFQRENAPIKLSQFRQPLHNLVLCDILGVGSELSHGEKMKHEGLSLAESIKQVYPMIKILSYSSNMQSYEDNYIAKTVVDGCFVKDLEINKRNAIIDDTIKSCFSPVDAWCLFRDKLLADGISIHNVARLENLYVGSIVNKNTISAEQIQSVLKVTTSLMQAVCHIAKITDMLSLG